jgi:hypothetical protein
MAEFTSQQERELIFARELGVNEDENNGLLLLVRGGGQNRHGCRSLKENGCRKPAWNRRDRMCYCRDGGAGLGSMSFGR